MCVCVCACVRVCVCVIIKPFIRVIRIIIVIFFKSF